MRGSRIDLAPRIGGFVRCLGAVVSVVVLTGGLCPVRAQTDTPLRLTPDAFSGTTVPPAPSTDDEPLRLTPLAPSVDEPRQAVPAEEQDHGNGAGSGIRVRPLGAPDGDDIALLRPENGAFPEDLWTGSQHGEVITFLEALPAPMMSPVQKSLAVRLLLSGGSFPGAGVGEPAGRRYGAIRVEKLAALGAVREALALADKLPGVLADEPAARALTRAELNAGSLDCAKRAETIRSFDTDYWARLGVLCRAMRGDRDSAQLGLDMLREKGDVDPAFEASIEKLAGEPREAPTSIVTVDAVSLAALKAAAFAPPAEALTKAAPLDAALIARNPAADPAMRVAAAERAAVALQFDARELQAAYAAIGTPSEDLARLASAEPTPSTRAQVAGLMIGAIDGRRRAEIAGLAARLVPAPWRAGPIGIAAAALFDSVNPMAVNGTLAPAAVKLFAAQGQIARAQRWYQPLAASERLRRDAIKLWPLAMLADAAPENDADLGIDVWLDSEGRANPPPRTLTLLPAIQALGIAVPAEATDRIPAIGTLVSAPDVVNRLSRASGEGRIGELLIIALDLLGDGGPGQTQPGVLARIADALMANGMEHEARAIVREAAAALTD